MGFASSLFLAATFQKCKFVVSIQNLFFLFSYSCGYMIEFSGCAQTVFV